MLRTARRICDPFTDQSSFADCVRSLVGLDSPTELMLLKRMVEVWSKPNADEQKGCTKDDYEPLSRSRSVASLKQHAAVARCTTIATTRRKELHPPPSAHQTVPRFLAVAGNESHLNALKTA